MKTKRVKRAKSFDSVYFTPTKFSDVANTLRTFLEDEEIFHSDSPSIEICDEYIDETFSQNLLNILNESTLATLQEYLE